jgi:DNA-directed RNA polymerase subunit omega
MAQGRHTLMDPPIEDLLDKVDSKFTLVALGSARARQVNSYYNSLGEGLGKVVPPQVASVSGKPVSIAFEEIAAGKATYTRIDPEEEAALVEAEAEVEVEVADEAADVVEEAVLSEVVSDDVTDVVSDDVTDVVANRIVDEELADVVAEITAEDAADSDLVAEAEVELFDVGDEDPTAS